MYPIKSLFLQDYFHDSGGKLSIKVVAYGMYLEIKILKKKKVLVNLLSSTYQLFKNILTIEV